MTKFSVCYVGSRAARWRGRAHSCIAVRCLMYSRSLAVATRLLRAQRPHRMPWNIPPRLKNCGRAGELPGVDIVVVASKFRIIVRSSRGTGGGQACPTLNGLLEMAESCSSCSLAKRSRERAWWAHRPPRPPEVELVRKIVAEGFVGRRVCRRRILAAALPGVTRSARRFHAMASRPGRELVCRSLLACTRCLFRVCLALSSDCRPWCLSAAKTVASSNTGDTIPMRRTITLWSMPSWIRAPCRWSSWRPTQPPPGARDPFVDQRNRWAIAYPLQRRRTTPQSSIARHCAWKAPQM